MAGIASSSNVPMQYWNPMTGQYQTTPIDIHDPTQTGAAPGAIPMLALAKASAHNAGPPDPGPVLQPGTAIPGAEGMDITKRGDAENFFRDNKGFYTAPSRTDKFADALTDRFGAGGENLPTTKNRADEAYEAFKAGPTSAGLDPYYQNAKRVAGEDIDKRLSARGMYGSSAADNAIQEAMTNLSAEEANRSADFDLRRFAEGGQLATGADTSELAGQANQRSWLQGLQGAGQAADTSDLNRMNSGMNAASSSQTNNMNRVTTGLNAEMGMGDRISSILGNGWGTMVDKDIAGQDNAITTSLGADANAVNAAQAHANERNTSTANAIDAGTNTAKLTLPMMKSGSGGGTTPDPVVKNATYSAQYPGTSSESWNQY